MHIVGAFFLSKNLIDYIFGICDGLNVWGPPKFSVLLPDPKCNGVRRWGLGQVIRSESGALMSGISAF